MWQCKQALTNFRVPDPAAKVNASETGNEQPLQPRFCQQGVFLIP